ncbi:MAG: hypothetical protein ABI625_23460, partial [bacterium]
EESGFGRSEIAWKELDTRQRFHTEGSSQFFGPEQLQKLGATPLDFVTRGVPKGRGVVSRSRGMPEGDACILENGYRPLTRPLRSYSASDVELIEYYPLAAHGHETELTGTVVSRMTVAGCYGEFGSHPAYYVLWLKGAR